MSDNDIRVTLCTDCVQLHANDETPGDYDEEAERLFLEIVRHNTAGWNVFVTCHSDCDDCLELECEYGHEIFSTTRCDSCGTWLAGSRCSGVMTPAEYPGAEQDRTRSDRMRTWNGSERVER